MMRERRKRRALLPEDHPNQRKEIFRIIVNDGLGGRWNVRVRVDLTRLGHLIQKAMFALDGKVTAGFGSFTISARRIVEEDERDPDTDAEGGAAADAGDGDTRPDWPDTGSSADGEAPGGAEN